MAVRTALLRGGIARSDLWARRPDQPVIAVSTVDQVGSRLLFRGYGVSDSMKPVHAGLLGNDVLYLLDEVHLSQPFRETLGAVADRYRSWAEVPLQRPFVVVEMSATAGHRRPQAFHLDDTDWRHPLLSTRLLARKPTLVVSVRSSAFIREVERRVTEVIAPGATVSVVVNRVATAREIHAHLRDVLNRVNVFLVTGRMRPYDRDALEKSLFPRLRSDRQRDPEAHPIVVVSTQCIEAGADFDFDAMVTECASLDALRQRFGRLDRLGALAGSARGVVVARTDAPSDDPVYGEAISKTWEWLNTQSAGDLDFGISGLDLPADAKSRGLLAPTAQAPMMLPGHLDAWVQTQPKPHPDPDVSLWLHGPARGTADVQVVWRADLSADLLTLAIYGDPGERKQASDVALGLVDAVPPTTPEAMPVPFVAVRRWLDGQRESDVFDVEGAHVANENDRPPPDTLRRPAVVWRGEVSEVLRGADLKPGDTVVVPVCYGGISEGTWDPAATSPVADVAEVGTLRQRDRVFLRLHPDVTGRLFGEVAPPAPAVLDSEDVDDRAAVLHWLRNLSQERLSPDGTEVLAQLTGCLGDTSIRVERLARGLEPDARDYYLVSERARRTRDGSDSTTEDDRSSFTGVEVTLSRHCHGVSELAGSFAARAGLPSTVVSDIKLAARWHDAGKADSRFQRLLHGGSEFRALTQAEPLAKAAVAMNDRRARLRAAERSGYPTGTRHELMSVALMSRAADSLTPWAHDWDLVLHLVASHHGRCRPFAPWVVDSEPVEVTWSCDGTTVTATSAPGLARLDSGVLERFWVLVRRYGWWGLAGLETLLRLADHRQSETEQRPLEHTT